MGKPTVVSSRGPKMSATREQPAAAHPVEGQFLQGPVHQLPLSATHASSRNGLQVWMEKARPLEPRCPIHFHPRALGAC